MQLNQSLDDKRNSIRLDFKVPVELYCEETDHRFDGELSNLSVHGMLVQLHGDYPRVADDGRVACKARIIIPGHGSNLLIENLETTIVRHEKNTLGLEFSEPLEWFLLFNVYRGKQLNP